ncbi:hypothetical protein [Rufibacter sp. XAAS-G3-1]|uniref:hypothetical protein n=1 Tax=Rufibacter sp. XAAS-G3-1 TaxID=2729134 RepID=UPI0015E6CC98|nr:hypothetical protein [Rufibacter sp. XAAS-G3-1]
MTTKDLKAEIIKVLDNVPENLLEHVLAYVQEVEKGTATQTRNAQHLKKILDEDREVLRKLAL